jgi:hypothetical protein
MTEFKKGDRVRITSEDEYDGKTGTVAYDAHQYDTGYSLFVDGERESTGKVIDLGRGNYTGPYKTVIARLTVEAL